MKFLSKLSGGPAIDSNNNDFTKARSKLIGIYLGIIATVIVLFSWLVIMQVDTQVGALSDSQDQQTILSETEAIAIAQSQNPNTLIDETAFALESNTLIYKVHFENDDEIEIDLFTGSVLSEKNLAEEGYWAFLTDEIDEVIGWLGLLVFLLASAGSIFVANATLQPIAVSMRKQKRFVSDAAHELRNPLAALQTTLESYIRSTTIDKELNKSVAEDLLSEVKRLISTSESLLSFEEHELRHKKVAEVNVTKSIERVEKRLKGVLETKSIALIKNIADTPLQFDVYNLDTVLYNLVHNASKFSPANSTISVKWDGTKIVITDTGMGISAKHLPHIFERFYKVEEARMLTEHSNGLGLALVHDILASYGATISTVSEVGSGTTFTIIFSSKVSPSLQ